MKKIYLFLFSLAFIQQVSAQRIFEIYSGGGASASATWDADYIILNGFAPNQNMAGWSLQYRGSTTTTWTVTALTGNADANGFFRFRTINSASGNVPFTPQMAGNLIQFTNTGSGQVALFGPVSGTTVAPATTPGTCPSGGSLFDLVGYVGITTQINSTCYEGTGSAPATSFAGTQSRRRKTNVVASGIDTDNNASDFELINAPYTSTCTNPTAYNVTGGGTICAGSVGTPVGVANSETGVTYQLILNGSNVGTPANGSTGNPVSFGNQTAAGTYNVVATRTSGGCTSTMIGSVTITVNAAPTAGIGGTTSGCGSVTLTANGGTSYAWSGGSSPNAAMNTFTSSGTYTVTVTNASGCTASTSANVTVNLNPTPSISGTNTICAGTSSTFTATGGATYLWSTGQGGTSISVSAATTYTVTATSAAGCTASDSRTLTVNSNPTAGISGITTGCGSVTLTANGGTSYAWSGGSSPSAAMNTFTSSGIYTVTVTNASGCTATTSANVTVNNNPVAGFSGTPSGCGSVTLTANGGSAYAWNGGSSQNSAMNTFTSSGTYVVTVTNALGCTATTSIAVTVTAPTNNTTTQSACDTYTWPVNGQTYTQSGTYTSVTGCNTETLVLTITPSTNNTTTQSACDSYTWPVNGQTYTQSGTYTSVTGCNTETLVLTITPSTNNTTTQSACDTYTWPVNGQTYTQSGTYTSVTGCNTETLVLTITPSTNNTTTQSACDSYTWPVNGQTYTQSGTYTSVTGCNTETLVLTITPSTNNTTTQSACDTYTWPVNGQTYTQSGTYTSVTGCNTETLVLTITPSTNNTTTQSACDSYTWPVNGQTYTQSGTYTSVTGCNTETLVLTITPSTNNTTTQSACDSYTWPVNGQTYTQSGTYTSVTACNTETLVLTITSSTTNTTTDAACDSYTWAVNGQTYTQSGTYTSVTACNTEILVLTITPCVIFNCITNQLATPDAPTLTNDPVYPSGLINATWPDVNAGSYRIYWRPTGTTGQSIRYLTTNSFTTPFLTANTSYDFWTASVCSTATSTVAFQSPVSTLATLPNTPGCIAPPVSCATSTATSITVNWPEVVGAVRIGARFSFAGQTGFNHRSSIAYSTTGGLSSFTFTGLQSNMTYTIRLFVECDGRTLWSTPVVCTTGMALPRLANEVFSFDYEGVSYEDVRIADYDFDFPAAGVPDYVADVSSGQLEITYLSNAQAANVNFSLTPNVTSNFTTLSIFTEQRSNEANVLIYDMQGALVYSKALGTVSNGDQFQLETSGLAAGVYNVSLQTAGQQLNQKLVVIK
jgi:hypothetical protein